MTANSWKPHKLDELGSVSRGRSRHRPRDEPSLYGGQYPFFQTGDIKAANFHLTDFTQTYSEIGLAQSKLWEAGTLCITIAANIAETAILGIRGCFPDSVVGFVANTEKAEVRFIKYYIDKIKLQMQSVSRGTTQDNLSVDKLLTFDFRVPLLSKQQEIADILSAYDELIENNQRRIQILEEMARALYREWFVLFRFPGHEKTKLFSSPMGNIPQGWEAKKLGDIAESMRRNFAKGRIDEPEPYVGLEHIPRRSLALDAWEMTTDLGSNKLEFKKGEILFGKIRPYFHKVSVAPFDGLCSADTIVIRPRLPDHYAIVAGCVSSDEFVAHATATSNGSKMPRANWSVMAEHPVAIPPPRILQQYSEGVESAIQQMQALIFQNTNLRKTRDLLLPRLLSERAFLAEGSAIKTTQKN